MSPSLAVLKVDPSFIFPLSLSQSLICALPPSGIEQLVIHPPPSPLPPPPQHGPKLRLVNPNKGCKRRSRRERRGVGGKLSQKGAACHPCRGPQSVENYCNGLRAEQDAHGPWSRFFGSQQSGTEGGRAAVSKLRARSLPAAMSSERECGSPTSAVPPSILLPPPPC